MIRLEAALVIPLLQPVLGLDLVIDEVSIMLWNLENNVKKLFP